MDHEARIAYLKSLPREEAERILHAEGVALQMKGYQKARILAPLAVLTYGSDKVLDRSVQSLADAYLHAYLAQPEDSHNAADALKRAVHADHSNTQTAGILMAKLETTRVAEAAERLNVPTSQVETALTIGIAELLDSGQLLNLSLMSFALYIGAGATKRLRHPQH